MEERIVFNAKAKDANTHKRVDETIPVCKDCFSEDIYVVGDAQWNKEENNWKFFNNGDNTAWCNTCDATVTYFWATEYELLKEIMKNGK